MIFIGGFLRSKRVPVQEDFFSFALCFKQKKNAVSVDSALNQIIMNKRAMSNRSIMHFQQWSRKSYAVFNSLSKVIKISGLAVVMVSITWANKARAQHDTNQIQLIEQNLEETEIVAQRSLVVNGELAKVVIVISRAEIEAAPVQSIQDVLSMVMNVDVRQRGKNDIQADINIRGGTFDQTLILLNGIPFNDPQTGHHSFSLPVDINQIQRIEILAGSGSRVNGPNAYSGAINVVTRVASQNELEVFATAGDFKLFKAGAALSLSARQSNHLVSVNTGGSGGYTRNTDFKRLNAFYSGRINFSNSYVQLQGGFTDKAFGANSFYTPKFPDQFEQIRSFFGSVKYRRIVRGLGIKTIAYYRGNTDRFELFRDGIDAAPWYSHHNYHWTNTAGLNTNFSYNYKNGASSIGFDYRYEGIKSNVLGEITGDTISALFDKEGFYTKAAERNNIAVFIEQVYQWNNFKAVGGIMANINSMFDNRIYWNPGIDLSYDINKKISVLAGVNKAMRIPTYTDLYYQGPTNVGNRNLLPEESLSYETGISFNSKLLSAHTTFSYRIGKNTIDWVRAHDTLKWTPMNATRVNSKSVEIALRFKPLVLLESGSHLIRTLNIGYGYTQVNKNSNVLKSYYVMDYLRHKLSVQLTHKILKNIYGSWNWVLQDRAGTYMHYDFNTGIENEQEYTPFNLMDLRIYWQYQQWYVFADASNLFNVQYIDFGNISQPGRWFTMGLRYKLQWKQDGW